jgi:hypothetical protein
MCRQLEIHRWFATFLGRHRFLAPDLSIFLIDDDRSCAPLAGRINGWLGGEMREPWREKTGALKGFAPSAERGEALSVGPHHPYFTNVKPSIVSALEACLRQFQRDRQRGQERKGVKRARDSGPTRAAMGSVAASSPVAGLARLGLANQQAEDAQRWQQHRQLGPPRSRRAQARRPAGPRESSAGKSAPGVVHILVG